MLKLRQYWYVKVSYDVDFQVKCACDCGIVHHMKTHTVFTESNFKFDHPPTLQEIKERLQQNALKYYTNSIIQNDHITSQYSRWELVVNHPETLSVIIRFKQRPNYDEVLKRLEKRLHKRQWRLDFLKNETCKYIGLLDHGTGPINQ